ncbi:Phosphoglucomutase, alpha-D-glucose phosphate-specific [Thermus sp. CCB_US3_UF1]|uniref:phosphoglucomutase (alpha-D-glucose-1,6-bisphosphate-dependent) n=1 Tax=Thermus sp. CCB_US3_UF1 TaxID=1111069 RepID=UPI0002389263|nr:phosphoglucomutase (alpha-D-glucose-1,6-bisphosphate-dependent) [Thermus sp. CCB_US3_UF1]AEV17117.1 Phosphoglucomutase, alpha-D-glucose phosphate-specific [Thermus sp. CCB_US3_UF1]
MDLPKLLTLYYEERPDPEDPLLRVAFGTSGHRGTSLKGTFTEAHVLAIAQAIADLRASFGATGPLFLAKDTHALSQPAWATALSVFAANGIEVLVEPEEGYTPTPLVSLAILEHNAHHSAKADGVLLTPSHNPPEDGGFKYNPPTGGPADTRVTKAIEARANALLKEGLKGVKRLPLKEAKGRAKAFDYAGLYVARIKEAVDLEAIRASGLRIGVDPLGGASLRVWERLAEAYRLNLEVVNPILDPTFRFMPPDHDGKIRMDCSSPYAMAGLLALKDRYDLAIGNDPDADRHGIVTPRGLMNPNHYLAAALHHLFTTRAWPGAKVGKTAVTSALLDRVAAALGREVYETPVGFKYFVAGLLEGWLGFGGEESAGASFLRLDGRPFSTDKDGILLGLLAAEMAAKEGKAPDEVYEALAQGLGRPYYARKDLPISPEAKAKLARLSPEDVGEKELAGEPIRAVLTRAPGNGEPLGGLKVVTENAWFAARPSGTEDVAKVYAESFRGEEHLEAVLQAALALVAKVLA